MVIIADPPWQEIAGLRLIGHSLGSDNVRIVGGAVRDTLGQQSVTDIDLATRWAPEIVRDKLEAVRIKVIATGIAHGTVTAALSTGPVEITTLRRDVSTDGRHATVAFTDDWREDAARRDFTINALYADITTGEVFDYFGGVDDLRAGIVRFIGEPLQRIAEDHLRILRFFRFHTRYATGAADPASLAACAARANDLMALSRERIADELLKLLGLPVPAATMELMLTLGIWAPVVPEFAQVSPALSQPGDAVYRLASLLPADPAIADSVAKRLKLSKAITKRLVLAAGRSASDADKPRALAYRIGREGAVDRLALIGRQDRLALLDGWTIPKLPIGGGALVKRGLTAGPDVARALTAVEEQWIAEGFPDATRVAVIADGVVGANFTV
jgi:poly(A) polymerase